MYFRIHRDIDGHAFRIRKVVLELFRDDGTLVDRRRMFAGLFFAKRLARKQARMAKIGKIMVACSYKL